MNVSPFWDLRSMLMRTACLPKSCIAALSLVNLRCVLMGTEYRNTKSCFLRYFSGFKSCFYNISAVFNIVFHNISAVLSRGNWYCNFSVVKSSPSFLEELSIALGTLLYLRTGPRSDCFTTKFFWCQGLEDLPKY